MPLSPQQLRCIPFLTGLSDQQLKQIAAVFEKEQLKKGDVLFKKGIRDDAFYLLAKGEVSIFEEEKLRYQLKPVTSIGELGALADLKRNTTATISRLAEVWKITREALFNLFESNSDIALLFYQGLVKMIADRVRRNQIRLEDMSGNIVRTQKAMKQMRDLILESLDTPISEPLHNELESLIQHNRRVNYRVNPPDTMPARVRFGDNGAYPVVEISRTHLSFNQDKGTLPSSGETLTGVLNLNGPELSISGKVLRTIDRRVDLELGLLIEEYGSMLDGYLTRIQMFDFMV
jgi:CRP/FNR family cyclic AMP-dependent transcriptional regulator